RFTKHLETLRLGPGMLHCDPADPVSHRDGSATLESATALGSCHPSRLWDSSFVCRSVRLQRGSHADSQRRHRCCLLRPIGLLSLFVEVRPAPSPNSKLCMQDSWSLASLWCTATSLTLAWSARVAWSRSAFLFLSAPSDTWRLFALFPTRNVFFPSRRSLKSPVRFSPPFCRAVSRR